MIIILKHTINKSKVPPCVRQCYYSLSVSPVLFLLREKEKGQYKSKHVYIDDYQLSRT